MRRLIVGFWVCILVPFVDGNTAHNEAVLPRPHGEKFMASAYQDAGLEPDDSVFEVEWPVNARRMAQDNQVPMLVFLGFVFGLALCAAGTAVISQYCYCCNGGVMAQGGGYNGGYGGYNGGYGGGYVNPGPPPMPKCKPKPEAIKFQDPRFAPESKEIGVIGFYFPNHEETWDEICGCSFLGNFYDVGKGGVELEAPAEPGKINKFRAAETAFQATKHWHLASEFRHLGPGEAFKTGRALTERGEDPDWTYAQFQTNWAAMLAVLRAKFKPKSAMAKHLAKTKDAYLLEHNATEGRDRIWSDNFNGEGTNWLGLQLMLVRDELSGKDTWTTFIKKCIDFSNGKALNMEAEEVWQNSVRSARTAVHSEVVRIDAIEEAKREAERKKREEKRAKEEEKRRIAEEKRRAKEAKKNPKAQLIGGSGNNVAKVHCEDVAATGQHLCVRPGCGKPSWNGSAGEYCSKGCAAQGLNNGGAQPSSSSSLCMRPNCGNPTCNGQPGFYCSIECSDHHKANPNEKELCLRQGCENPTFDGRKGYCSRQCESAHQSGNGVQSQSQNAPCPRCNQESDRPGGFCMACRNGSTTVQNTTIATEVKVVSQQMASH